MFRDNYTNFSFDEQDSSSFKVWITNKNDLKRNMSPNFSDKFNTPTFGQIRYHEGTTIDKQDFKFSCAAVDITLNEWRAITEWLSPLKSGKLRFDWNDKYYYMVKLSKAPSGTMFMKGKLDNIRGQLYIITFDLEFTTISDWAAVGEYGEQEIKKKVDGTSLVVDNFVVNPSVFNNPYYMPQVVWKEGSVTEETYEDGDPIYGGWDELKINIKNMSGGGSENTFANIYYYEKKKESDTHGIRKAYLVRHKNDDDVVDGLTYKKVYDVSEDLTWDIFYAMDEEGWVYLPCEKNVYIVFINEWTGISCVQSIKESFLLTNPGSLPSYPLIYTKSLIEDGKAKNTIVSYSNEEWYNYSLKIEDPLGVRSPIVEMDCRNGSINMGGRPIQLWQMANYERKILPDVKTNKGILEIESGRPELQKVYLEKITTAVAGTDCYTFRLSSPFIYDRHKPFIFNLFNKNFVEDSNRYNKDKYSSEQYSFNYSDYLHLVLDSPYIKIRKEQGKMYLDVYIYDDHSLSNYTSWKNTLVEKNWYYISLSDYSEIQIKDAEQYSIGYAIREVI